MAEFNDAGFETARAVWHAWQRHGFIKNDPQLIPVALSALPSRDLGPEMVGVFEPPVFPYKLHLVLPSAAQLAKFHNCDVVNEWILNAVESHPCARPDMETVLVAPLLAQAIQSYALLEAACARGVEDDEAWEAFCCSANPPNCAFSTPVPVVWFVRLLYDRVAIGTIVEHVNVEQRSVRRHFAVVTKPLMMLDARVLFEASLLGCSSASKPTRSWTECGTDRIFVVGLMCIVVIPIHLVETWALAGVSAFKQDEYGNAYIRTLRQDGFVEIGAMASSVCALPVVASLRNEGSECEVFFALIVSLSTF